MKKPLFVSSSTVNFDVIAIFLRLLALDHRYSKDLNAWLTTTEYTLPQRANSNGNFEEKRSIAWLKEFLYPSYVMAAMHWCNRLMVEMFLVRLLRKSTDATLRNHFIRDGELIGNEIDCEFLLEHFKPEPEKKQNEDSLSMLRHIKAGKPFVKRAEIRRKMQPILQKMELAGQETILLDIIKTINDTGLDPEIIDAKTEMNKCLKLYLT